MFADPTDPPLTSSTGEPLFPFFPIFMPPLPLPSLPEPLGDIREEFTINRASAGAYEVRQGETLQVIDVMGEVGRKMDVRYRETALGGLATTPAGQEIAAAAGMERLVQLQRKGRTAGESSARIGPS